MPRLLFINSTTMLQVPLPFSAVETSDHTISSYISDGFFSHIVCCCNGTSTRENTHGELFLDISRSVFSPSYLFFFLSHVPVAQLLEKVSVFHSRHQTTLIIFEGMTHFHQTGDF